MTRQILKGNCPLIRHYLNLKWNIDLAIDLKRVIVILGHLFKAVEVFSGVVDEKLAAFVIESHQIRQLNADHVLPQISVVQ